MWSDLPALECAVTEKRFSYSDIQSMARRFGAGLLQQGLRPGDRIATMVPNCPEFGPVLLGSLGVGVTLVPISPLLTPSELGRILDIARPKMVITADPLIPVITEADKGKVRASDTVQLELRCPPVDRPTLRHSEEPQGGQSGRVP